MDSKYEYIKNLLDQEIIQDIIFGSEIKNYIDLDKITKEQVDNYFFNCIELINLKPKLLERFISESEEYVQSKYHKENLITHLYCVGYICLLFADKFQLNYEYAFQLGFFHDIGKPWAKKFIQTKKGIKSSTKAHAQVGENICCELGLDNRISWCVSNHMCSCCHQNNLKSHWEYVGALQCLSLFDDNTKKEQVLEYGKSLSCLMLADDLGRLGENEKNISNAITHSDTWFQWFKDYIEEQVNPVKHSVKYLGNLHPDNSIIVNMYGLSGFGKSTGVKNLCKILDTHGISWEVAERDLSYYNIYAQAHEISTEYAIENYNYKTVHKFAEENDLKYSVQINWVEQLNSILDSDSKVKIIDTVQLIYPNAWEATLSSLNPDAYSVWKSSLKFGFYGFPQSLYSREFEPKTGKVELIPRDASDGLTWPTINSELEQSEKFNPGQIDIGYGSIKFLANSIINYNTWSQLFAPDKQVHLIKMLSGLDKQSLTSYTIQEHIQKQFPPGIVNSNEEYTFYGNHLIRFSYKDGMQIFHGPSRDYRGETILFDRANLTYWVGRVSLPVFSDYSDIRKDPGAQKLINSCTQFHIIPKFDGSLFVLALIKSNTPQYSIVKNLLQIIDKNSWIENELGIWCFGSKGCMFAKNQNGEGGVLTRITNSIKASYGTVEHFIKQIGQEIKSNGFYDIYTNISLCFEAIDSNPTDELTVDYGRAFCPFLCWIVWDGENKNIILPRNILHLNPIAQITTVNTWDEVIEFRDLAHSRLLDGSESDEPEGYVVWFGDTNIGVKLKHPEYYVAHKPYSKKNAEKAKHIEFSDDYAKLRPRLIKFKPKPPIRDLIDANLKIVYEIFNENLDNLVTRKTWAMFWKNENNVKQIDELFGIIESSITTYYPQFKNTIRDRGFNMAMEYFEKQDGWIDNFYHKYLKL